MLPIDRSRSCGSATWAPSPTATRSPSRSGSARAGRPTSCPTRCCCSSTRPSTRAGGAPAPRTCRSARTSTARKGIEVHRHRPRRAASPTTAPASSSATRSWRIDDVRRHLRTMEDAIVAALASAGVAGALAPRGGHRLHRRLGRGAQDRLDRRARLARRHHARLRRQRRQRPRAVLVGRRLRAARRRA